MRLTPQQIQTIRETVHNAFGPEARVYLFGSRVDDSARGGDLDLYIEVDRPVHNRAAAASRLAAQLQLVLGDQQIDVLVADPATYGQPIHRSARAQGIPL